MVSYVKSDVGWLNQDRVERNNSANTGENTSPRKVLLEQLSRILPADDSLPEQVVLANTCDNQAAHLSAKLVETGCRVINTAGAADVRATLTCLVTKLQKFCNTNVAPPTVMRVGLIGSDAFLNSMLRPYVELFSGKPPDWQNHILFYVSISQQYLVYPNVTPSTRSFLSESTQYLGRSELAVPSTPNCSWTILGEIC